MIISPDWWPSWPGQLREQEAVPCDRSTLLRQAEKAEQAGNPRLAAKLREAAQLAE